MTYVCTGIKHCEYLFPELQEMHHMRLYDDDWKKIIQLRQENIAEPIRKQANRYEYIVNILVMH